MTNTDERAASFLTRLIALEEVKRGVADDRADLLIEMKSAHLLKEEVAGIKLAVRRHFESQEKRGFRVRAEEFAESLGDFKDTPLGVASVERAIKNIGKAGGGTISADGEVLLTIPGVAARA